MAGVARGPHVRPDRLPITIALAALLATVAHGCAAQLREPALRSCAEHEVVVEQCKADATCLGATLTNERGEVYGVLEALETSAEQACAVYEAAGGKR